MEMPNVPDFTGLTCTNLMIKLKIILKKLGNGEVTEFIANREQFDNIQKPFSKNGLSFSATKVGDNRYHCKIKKGQEISESIISK